MRRIPFVLISGILAILLVVSCQTGAQPAARSNRGELLGLDPQITFGKLPNGLTYYIRVNHKPEGRAELRLAVNAGSVLEDDDQRGIAHFLEHLAFNGTLNFKKDALINYMESIGMRFGGDLNAYTSWDETVYRLQVPTDDLKKLDTALLILEDWAHNISIEPEEVDKERGIIIEEWRMDRGADERINEQHLAAALSGSRYPSRRPLGDMSIIEKVSADTIRRFYQDWYRPDLMSVMVVGDVDPVWVKQQIEEKFGKIPVPASPRQRPDYPVPGNKEPIISIAVDPEATSSFIRLYFKHAPSLFTHEMDYRDLIVEYLVFNMLDERLTELSQKAGSPFSAAYDGVGRFVRTLHVGLVGGQVKNGQVKEAVDALAAEMERVRRFGFLPSELARAKQNALSGMEQAYAERDKRESDRLAAEYIRNYLEGESAPGIEKETELYNRFVPGITLEEINGRLPELFPDQNRVLLVGMPDRQDQRKPAQQELAESFRKVKDLSLSAWVDDAVDSPLLPAPPVPGKITATIRHANGITEWVLSNGAHVLLKPTTFKNDEIIMRAFSPGGLSLVPEDLYVPASTATALVSESGAAGFTKSQLEKLLTGKEVSVAPFMDDLYEGFTGATRPVDLREMFEMTYLYFMSPRMDADVFTAVREKLASAVLQRSASPETVFWDTVKTMLSQDHPRSRPWTRETVERMNMEKSLAVYRDRFSNAGDFTFVFTGNFTLDQIKPLVLTYIASLPDSGKRETVKDLGMSPAPGQLKKQIFMGKDPKSMVLMVYHGALSWNLPQVAILKAITEVMDMRLTDAVREKSSGAYTIQAWDYPRRVPRQEYTFSIFFGCEPGRVNELTALVVEQIKLIAAAGITDEELAKVREILVKEREVDLADNSIWAELIKNYRVYSEPFERITELQDEFAKLTKADIQAAVKKYLNDDNFKLLSLYPEGFKPGN